MKKKLRRHKIYNIGIHLAALIYFIGARFFAMAYINIISLALYAIDWFLIENNHYRASFFVDYLEHLIYAMIATIIMGSEGGFIVYGFICILQVFYSSQIGHKQRYIKYNAYIVLSVLMMLVAELVTFSIRPSYFVGDFENHVFRIYNMIIMLIECGIMLDIIVDQIRSSKGRLQEQKSILEKVSRHDVLTGLNNRRSMIESFAMASTTGQSYALIMIDIDDFKQVNDTYGHDCGDYVLVKIANIVTGLVRKCDVVSRWGGEEMLVFLPGCDMTDAVIIAERIRSEIAQTNFDYQGIIFNVTITAGVETSDGHESSEDVVKVADGRLYKGKNSGKNKVVGK